MKKFKTIKDLEDINSLSYQERQIIINKVKELEKDETYLLLKERFFQELKIIDLNIAMLLNNEINPKGVNKNKAIINLKKQRKQLV